MGPAAAVAGEEPKMGIFARALWFHKHGAAAKAASVPGLQKMLDQYGPSAGAWILTLQDMTPQQRRDRPLAVGLICKSLTAQTGTQSVERWLGEVRFAELKHRARALAEDTLESCVKLNVQDFTGRLAGKAFNPDSLFRDQAQSAQRGVRHRASNYGLQCQNSYRQLYGEKKDPGRSLLPADPVQEGKPKLNRIRKTAGPAREIMKDVREKHTQSVSQAAAASSKDRSQAMEAMVQAQTDVAKARTGVTEGVDSRKRLPANDAIDEDGVEQPQTPAGSHNTCKFLTCH